MAPAPDLFVIGGSCPHCYDGDETFSDLNGSAPMAETERQELVRRVDELTTKVDRLLDSHGEMKGKLDVVFVLQKQNETAHLTCREHCESNKKAVWDAMTEMRRFNPVWIYAGGMTILAILGLINLFLQWHGHSPVPTPKGLPH